MNEVFKLMGKVTIEIVEAVKNLDKVSEEAESTQSKVVKAFDKVGEAVKKGGEKTEKLVTSVEKMTKKTATLSEKLERQKKYYEGICEVMGENSESAKDCAEEIENLTNELEENEEKLEKAREEAERLDGTLEEVGDEAENARKSTKNFGDSLDNAGSSGKKSGELISTVSTVFGTAGKVIGGVASVIGGAFSAVADMAQKACKITVASIAAISAAFIGLGTIAVNYTASLEEYQTNFEVMLGSQEEAVSLMEQLKDIAANTPLELSDLAQNTELLLNYGVAVDEVTDKLSMLGDLSLGKSDKLSSIATAYGQMTSLGKVTQEDVNQMISAGYNPLEDIAAMTGEPIEKVRERLQAGKISVEEITAAMEHATSEGGKYYQAMEKQSQTLNGKLSTLKDTVNNGLGKAFEGVSEILSSKVLPTLIDLAETYVPKLGEIVEVVLPYLEDAAELILPLILSGIEMALPLVVQFIDDMGPVLLETLETLGPVLLDIASEILPILLDTISELAPILLPMIAEILPLLAEILLIILPIIAENLPTAIEKLTPYFEEFCTFLEETFIPALESSEEVIGTYIDNIGICVSTFAEAIASITEGSLGMVGSFLEAMQALMDGDLNLFTEKMLSIEESFNTFLQGLFELVFGFWISMVNVVLESEAWNNIVAKFNDIKENISQTFENIKSAITEKIQGAVDFVKEGIETLKSYFNFEWELPDLKLPHFSVSGSFSLNPLSVPTFGIEWYAKGGVMTEPTAFGINPNTGNVMVGGEAGAEAIAPISTLQQYVAEAVASQNASLIEVLYKILAAITSMDENMGENLSEALEGVSLGINKREITRIVRTVN